MTDFETRLADALRGHADDAPENERLAAGARRRSRRRRRTRAAAGIAAVAVLAVPVALLAVDRDSNDDGHGRLAHDPAAGWRTVEYEGVAVDVPSGWQQHDVSTCLGVAFRYGPPDADPCSLDNDGLMIVPLADTESYRGPGVFRWKLTDWAGHVPIGDWVVGVQSDERDLAQRVLGSSREAGQEAPDLSAGFRTETYDGLSVDVPATWREGTLRAWCADEAIPGWVERPDTVEPDVDCPTPERYYGIRFGGGRPGDQIRERSAPEYPDGSWAGVAVGPRGNEDLLGIVEIVAPTQGLAELIGGSVRAR